MVKRKSRITGGLFRNIFVVLIFFSFAYFFRPWLHDLFMFFYRAPVLVELLIILFIAHQFFKRKEPKFDISGRRMFFFGSTTFTLLILFLMFSSFFSTVMPQLYLVNNLNYKTIEELPGTKENIRLMPYEVSYRYSKDSLQLSQYRLGTGNIANVNGHLTWMFPLVPDGSLLQFLLKNKGVVFVDATTQKKNTNIVWKDLSVGEGMEVFDNLYWNIYKEKYLVDLDDPFYIPYGDEIYTVIPVISYSYHQWFGLFYAVPEFGGVITIDSHGKREFLTPEEAVDTPYLKENRIFPEKLARYYVESYVYNNGLINKWFIHNDQIDIQDISYQNRQPFLMDTSDGLKWFISTEPYGESHGIFKIFLIDAVNGYMEKYELPLKETLTGPMKARDFVRKENPRVDWSKFKMVEPLPFITNNILYWKLAVIPDDAAGIAYQAFVNSKTNDVLKFNTDEEIQNFIKMGIKTESTSSVGNVTKTNDETIEQIKQKLKEIDDLLGEIES